MAELSAPAALRRFAELAPDDQHAKWWRTGTYADQDWMLCRLEVALSGGDADDVMVHGLAGAVAAMRACEGEMERLRGDAKRLAAAWVDEQRQAMHAVADLRAENDRLHAEAAEAIQAERDVRDALQSVLDENNAIRPERDRLRARVAKLEKERDAARPLPDVREWKRGAGDQALSCDVCGTNRRIVAWGWPGAYSICAECVEKRGINPVGARTEAAPGGKVTT